MKKALFVVIVLALTFSFQEVEAQCAMCKASATSAKEQGNTFINGLNSGILFLMAIPYVLLLFFFRRHIKNLFKEIAALYRK